MAVRTTLELVAALLDGTGWPAQVRAAADVVVAAAEHDQECAVCPRVRFDSGLLSDVRAALSAPFRGVAVDEELGAALVELAAEVERRPRRCPA